MSRWNNVTEVVECRLCIGCGACAPACPQERVGLFDFSEEGIRPVIGEGDCSGCRACVDVCPGVEVTFPTPTGSGLGGAGFEEEWGPVLEIWEGHATDPEIRFQGSSGGALTALGAYCLEKEAMGGVLHIAEDPEDPVRNRTRLSRSRAELVAATGSRYAPASVGNGFGIVAEADAPCVIIGKPSEIAALHKSAGQRPELEKKIGVTLSFFCAETPATEGTMTLLESMGIVPRDLGSLRYRGKGWPGHFAPVVKGEEEPRDEMTYRESWASLQAHRPWSAHLWPDGGGELADISCGDPWYEEPDGSNPGFSIVVVRTERGRRILEGAVKAGYLELNPAEAWKLERSQSGLLRKKGAVWGRLLAMRVSGMPVPRFSGAALFTCWKTISVDEKLKSFAGTLRRIFSRGLRKPYRPSPGSGVPVPQPVVSSETAPGKGSKDS